MRPAPVPHPAALDRAAVRAEMDQARADFRRLVSDAAPADLRRPSDGTRWTNRQLLFHMLFGYLIVRALLILARAFGLLPRPPSSPPAPSLPLAPASSRPGGCPCANHVIAALQRHLERETESALRRGMHYPATWDPFFASYMTLADLYRYPTRHFRFHQRQLTLGHAPAAGTAGRRRWPPRGRRR